MKQGWAQIPWSVIDRMSEIGHAAMLTYLAIVRHADRDGTAWPSLARLGEITNQSRRSVIRAIKQLSDAGLIVVTRRSLDTGSPASNVYRLSQGVVTSVSLPSDTRAPRGSDTRAPGVVTPEHHEVTTENQLHMNQSGRKRPMFVKPTLLELREHIAAKALAIDPEAFLAHYESNGWRVGRNPMKCWRSALTTWHKNRRDYSKPGSVANAVASRPIPPPRPSRNGVPNHAK